MTDGGGLGLCIYRAGQDLIELVIKIPSNGQNTPRGWTLRGVCTGGHDGGMGCLGDGRRDGVRGDADGHFIPPAGNPVRGALTGRNDPGGRPRPVGTDLGKFFWGKRYPRMELFKVGGEQNQALAPVPLFERQYPLDGDRIQRVATKTKHRFGGIGDHAALRKDLTGLPKAKGGVVHHGFGDWAGWVKSSNTFGFWCLRLLFRYRRGGFLAASGGWLFYRRLLCRRLCIGRAGLFGARRR